MSETFRTVDAAPHAASLVQGHRDFGYDLQTALADIIDNAIAAGAREIKLTAETLQDEPWIGISDNGCGMTEAELVEAMRLGSKNPTDVRERNDLGRFGLGLKSASFSQCKCLTVITRRDGVTSCARWDLDRIARQNDWGLQLIDHPERVIGHDMISRTGTVVIWEKLDRLGGGFGTDRARRAEHINAELSRTERHLRLVFHRFLEGAKPRVKLWLNGRLLQPIDPMAHATQSFPDDAVPLAKDQVRFKCYTLPHHSRVSREAWEELGGPEGHLKSQGLYVYREDRLIIAGGWFGLARQTELTKLCRVSVDIPNSMDSEWKIGVTKSSVQLPPPVRERLKKVVEDFVGASKHVYRKKGRTLVDETRFPIWQRISKDGKISFKPNLQHPVFVAFAEQLPENLREGFESCVRLVGSGLPVEALHADMLGNPEAVVPDETEASDLRGVVETLATTFIDFGVATEDLADTLQRNPFLKARWAAASPMLEEFIRKQEA